LTSTADDRSEWLGLPLKSLVAILIGVVLLGIYIGILLFGENSILVLDKLQKEERSLEQQKLQIKASNQKLQKEYFELLQISN